MSKTIIFLFLLTVTLLPQLKELEIANTKAPSQPPVFVNYPDSVAVITYSSIEGINFEYNTT